MSEPAAAVFFDFDGVLVDSVPVKTAAFAGMLEELVPEDRRAAAMRHYLGHGGTPRRLKFRWIFENLLDVPLPDAEADRLGADYGRRVADAVVACDAVAGAEQLLRTYGSGKPLFVLSGTPQDELADIVRRRGWTAHFREVVGSPPDKAATGRRLLAEHALQPASVRFVGDATTDRDAAEALGVGFVGVHGQHLSPFRRPGDVMVDDLTALPALLGWSP